MYKYEVHIVAYHKPIVEVPLPFFLNTIDMATQGFSGIATVETDSIAEAYDAFILGCQWGHHQVQINEGFGCHVKLEEVKSVAVFDTADLVRLPSLVISEEKISSSLIAAWDIHLDGQFCPELIQYLIAQHFILLEYDTTQGNQSTTLTLHYLRSDLCHQHFDQIRKELQASGGFRGKLYWEDPLAFVVYGPTIPRPILAW